MNNHTIISDKKAKNQRKKWHSAISWKAEWRDDAFRSFPPFSAAFRHFPPFPGPGLILLYPLFTSGLHLQVLLSDKCVAQPFHTNKIYLMISKKENCHERPTKLFLFYDVSSLYYRLFIVSLPCILGEQLLIWGMKQWLENEAMGVWSCSYREWQCGQKINEFRWIHFSWAFVILEASYFFIILLNNRDIRNKSNPIDNFAWVMICLWI